MFLGVAASPSVTCERLCAVDASGITRVPGVDETLGGRCSGTLYSDASSSIPFLHHDATFVPMLNDDGSLSYQVVCPEEGPAKDVPGVLVVHGLLGTGSFAKVYACDMVADDGNIRTYAVKMPTGNVDVYAEVENQKFFSHPNIVHVVEVFSSPLAIVLEMCAGGTLQHALHGSSMAAGMDDIGLKARIEALIGLTSALVFLHSHNIVHRDIKSGNVLLATQLDGGTLPLLKLGDFGFSKLAGNNMTASKGTLRYMAPEVMLAMSYGLPADVYSFSMLLYETVTGRRPFHAEKHVHDLRLVVYIASGLRPHLTMYEDDPVFSEVAGIIEMGWAADPEDRPSAIGLSRRLIDLMPIIPENLKMHVSDHDANTPRQTSTTGRHV